MRLFSKLLLSLALLVPQVNAVSAGGDKYPSVYAVHQQQGPVCPYLPWANLEKIRAMRQGNEGKIVFRDEDFISKVRSYAYFLPRIRTLDNMYDALREEGGDYAAYERALREEGIKSSQRFNAKGKFVDKIDRSSVNQARRAFASPYNIKVIENPYEGHVRWLPILQKQGTEDLYFFDHESGKKAQLPNVTGIPDKETDEGKMKVEWYVYQGAEGGYKTLLIEGWMLKKMGVSHDEVKKAVPVPNYLGFDSGYVLLSSPVDEYNKEYFYDVGSYQHMLFACGVKPDNTSFEIDDDSLEARAYREFHGAMTSNPHNPWAKIRKEDLFEYQLAKIFKADADLKAKAAASVDYYNNFWQLYRESFDLYDAPKSPRIKLSEKQRFMPGEDQMLAYYFSNQLRFLWAASISMDAVIAIEELEDELSEKMVKVIKKASFLPGVPSEKKVIAAAEDKKFGPRKTRYSFLDVWRQIREILLGAIDKNELKRDLVTFSSHGSVISFDDELVQMQDHESTKIAQQLGFEMWDSTYDKGLKPFYRRSGKKEDKIEF